jgi:hypothetical protein
MKKNNSLFLYQNLYFVFEKQKKMNEHEAEFDPPLDDRFKCPICLMALRDPYQTKCGHRLTNVF